MKRTNRKPSQSAFDAADKEYSDAIRLAEVLVYKLEERRCAIAKDPTNWGHVGDAAHVRGKVEELLVNFYDIDPATEEEGHREVRRQAGISIDRDWS